MFDYFKGFVTDKRKTAKGAFVTIETAGTGYLLRQDNGSVKDFSQIGLQPLA